MKFIHWQDIVQWISNDDEDRLLNWCCYAILNSMTLQLFINAHAQHDDGDWKSYKYAWYLFEFQYWFKFILCWIKLMRICRQINVFFSDLDVVGIWRD